MHLSFPAFSRELAEHSEAFVFDPFNRPFEEIVVQYSPDVAINSASRVHFAELKAYL
jgi:hypothetical protein